MVEQDVKQVLTMLIGHVPEFVRLLNLLVYLEAELELLALDSILESLCKIIGA